MRRKMAICILAAAICILLGCVYALFFGKSGFLNSERRAVSGGTSGNTGENTAGETAGNEADSAEKDVPGEGTGEDVGEQTDSGETENKDQEIKENAGSSLVFSRGNNADMERMVPSEVLDVIDKINAGESPADAVGMEELEGYYALTTTHMIIAKDKETEKEATGSGKLILYVPNLLGGLQDVSVLVYDCSEKEWKLIPADAVDVEKKMISVTMSGSGVVTTVHRVQ